MRRSKTRATRTNEQVKRATRRRTGPLCQEFWTPWTPSPNRPPPGVAVHRRGPLLNITDTFGYETGDAVLRIVAWSTANRLRRGDVPTRWGGEEPWSCSPIPTRPAWKPRLSGYGYSYRRHSSDVGRRAASGSRPLS
ncbi:MAG: diguanylate cyclase [Cellulomonas sp.]|uniref:diguanylate cyclase domain-containing protein n=1 Tax=Cellulomonas sp. TaxID=40001 RepID=UPI0017B3D617|nr:diguanylate cyclase [Cellulomonas sp.]